MTGQSAKPADIALAHISVLACVYLSPCICVCKDQPKYYSVTRLWARMKRDTRVSVSARARAYVGASI